MIRPLEPIRTPEVPPLVRDRIEDLGTQIRNLAEEHARLESLAGVRTGDPSSLEILHGYVWVFVVAFLITLVITPVLRRLAIANGIVDRPDETRKVHRLPVAYLGGVAVFLGLMGGILYSYVAAVQPGLIDYHNTKHMVLGESHPWVPTSILLGMMIIMLVGLLDDVTGISPRIKIAGQLIAAAALAADKVGVQVAKGILSPTLGELLGNRALTYVMQIPTSVPFAGGESITIDLIYWVGTAIIAVFVIGACNASNLIDGLDGLLSGVTAIATAGLLVIALTLAAHDDGPRDAQRLVLCLALLGACLGFLPHNFNPASIFLGDAGSLLLGYSTVVIILTLGDTGKTPLVFAGLFIYAIPIIDTTLAIIRRKLAGKSISDADDQHLHHMFKRALGVKLAVLSLYAIGCGFALLGVAMSLGRARITYVVALLFASFIAVAAIKAARRKQLEDQSLKAHATTRADAPTAPPPQDAAKPPLRA